jgi:DNA-binding protein H-NS
LLQCQSTRFLNSAATSKKLLAVAQLKEQLSRLGDEAGGYRKRGRGSSLRGRKVAIKYCDRSGNTWAGRGAQPVWLREKLKAGAKLEDFAVQKTVASSQGFSKEIQEATQGKTLSPPSLGHDLGDRP